MGNSIVLFKGIIIISRYDSFTIVQLSPSRKIFLYLISTRCNFKYSNANVREFISWGRIMILPKAHSIKVFLARALPKRGRTNKCSNKERLQQFGNGISINIIILLKLSSCGMRGNMLYGFRLSWKEQSEFL